MHATRRRLSITVTAAAGLAALMTGATPAYAATPPSWPTTSKVPTGCAAVAVAGSGSGSQFTFTDLSVPAVASAGVQFAGSKRVLVVPPAGTPAVFEVTVTGGCSGVGAVAASLIRPNGTGGTATLGPVTTDAFSGRWRTPAEMATPANAGPYTFVSADVRRRYDSFVLDSSFKFLSAVPSGAAATKVVGPWSTSPIYILRATTLTSAVSKTKVARGKTVTVTGVYKVADVGGYVGYPGVKVVVSTKVGSGAWKSRTTLTTNGTGAVSWTLKITKKTQIRLAAKQVLAPLYGAAATSATRLVKLA